MTEEMTGDMTDQTDIEIPGSYSDTDIAIIGMSGRFPGSADVTELWANIRAGASGLTHFTDAELRAAGVAEHLLADPSYVKAAAVIEGIDQFDADFFGVGPREAQILDPQQRLYLEHNWQALEDAGCDPTRFDGAIGVFGGSAWSSYLQHNLMPSPTANAMGEMVVGLANDKDSLTTRVAHTLGLTGPAFSIQSYCSTSLVAVCVASSSLANFECDLALAGGVAVNVPHRVGYLYSEGGIAPSDAECRAFDAAGQGAVLGSGVGVVALRRLSDALAAGDRIYAVIRGWAVNNDGGRKVGFTAPGVQGQAAVIAEALSSADLGAADIDYIEAHGTGTALGDASELAALQQVFSGQDCLIGSIKTNLGHLDRAAGVTNLIKTSLALHRSEIPPTRNLRRPNPQLSAGDARLEVVTELRDWPRSASRTRRAGVSAFGIGGTNAHVVLEEAPITVRPEPAARPELLVWSARTAAAADARTDGLAGHLTEHRTGSPTEHPAEQTGAGDRLCDVAHTLQSGRRAFEHRRVLVASTAAEAVLGINTGQVLSSTESRTDRPVAFLIAGTGEQYPGMAADLYRDEPVFRAALEHCRGLLIEQLDGLDPLAEMLAPRLTGDDNLSRLLGREPDHAAATAGDQTDRLQPATFAVEYALAQLVLSWGIKPSVLAGYSVGEYVAACLSGVLSLESALALVAYRATLIKALPAGAMAAVSLSPAELAQSVERAGIEGLDVAAVNGAQLTVVSGEPAAISALRAFLETESVPCRPLATGHAFHSRMLEPVKAALTAWVTERIPLAAPRIPYLSNVTGTFATAEQVTDPAYWAEHMCAPVLFDATLKTLLAQEDLALLEIGPGQSLGAMARGHQDCSQDRWRRVVASLPAASDPRPAGTVLAEMVGRLWLAGVAVDWAGYQQDRPVAKVGLPGYPFQRERYWIDAPATVAQAAGATAGPTTAGASTTTGPATAGPDTEDHVQLLSPRWLPTPLSGPPAAAARHILLTDGALADGVAQALAGMLGQAGAEPILVRDSSGLAELVRTAPAGVRATVLDLRLLDRHAELDGREQIPVIADLINACGSDGALDASIVLVTRGGQSVNPGESPLPGHAAAAVLPVVANMEYLNLECRAVDLDPAADAAAAATALAAELANPATEVLVAYRDGRRYLRGFGPDSEDPTALPAVPVRSGGTYLITGGLGGIGLVLAEHLARSGARRLVLTSRSGAPTDAEDPRQRVLERLREQGVELVLARADASDAAAMRAVLAQTLATGPLDGIVHAAAQVGRDTFRPLRSVDADSVAVHFEAKVGGAQVLQALLAELPAEQAPDFCVLFSSTSAVLGGLGFASYAAANAALTAIACRNAAGSDPTRWIAASWDTWANTLEQAQNGTDGTGATMLAHSMTSEQGLAAFDQLLAKPRASVIVAAAGLADRLPRLVTAIEEPVAADQRYPRPELPQPYAPPLTATERALAEVWAGVLGVEPVGTRDNFFDLSGNSLLALQMLALVKKRFGVAVASVTLFEAPTVHALAAVLEQQGGGLANRPASSVTGLPAHRAATTSAAARPTPVTPATAAPATVPPATAAPTTVPPAAKSVTLAPAARTRSHRTVDDDDRRIAVVGMAGRFPGAGDVGAFWQNLCNGVESISFFNEEELLASGVSQAELSGPNYVPARPVLDDISGFDAGFFGISPRMAALTDPQQRLFLEVCWEALEQSGYAAAEHRGRVGVYGGANISTYLLQMPEEAVLGNDVSTYEIIMGNDKDALTTTVSYLFDLYGPSVAVQTFCSTSLVATHLAMQSLRNGECELALAGGVSIRVPNKVGHTFGPGGMESPDGHVRTFDANARGSMFGDGAAVVALKRLPDAIRDGDHIWSVLRGSAINNDGALKVGYTAPSVVGQARVIADALADAGVTGEDISYIEAHGTATELGDPIELAALTRAFGATVDNQYCPIGSVKTNIGHLDRAAGVTGLIKTSMALREELIPASLHYTSPNPEIDFENSPFYVNTGLSPWRTRDGRLPMAGINSLGMGGTNVHVVVEQAPTRSLSAPPEYTARRYQVLPVSARTATAADQACGRLAEHLGGVAGARLADVAYTLQVGRKTFEHRRVAVAQDLSEAAGVLSGAGGGASLLSRVDAVRGRQLAMLFTGVGEQYPGMVRELYRREPVFAAALGHCLTLLRPELAEVDLLDLLTGPRGAVAGLAALLGRADSAQDARGAALERTEVVQPALFAVEYALARTLQTWGVQPQVMLGYSLGEYVAACLSGVLSLPDALALVCHRAKLIATVAPGSMIAVSLPAEQLQARFGLAARQLDIAALNGPQVTVVAGPVQAVRDFAEELRQAEVPCRLLSTTHAFHSRMLEQVGDQLTSWVAANVVLNAPELPYISNLTGDYAEADLVCDPGYWARHMCQPVQFAAGVQTLLADPELAVLEVGPGQSLGALIRSAGAEPRQWPLILALLPAANDSRPDDAVFTDALARLWLLGVELDWVSHHNRQPDAQVSDTDSLPGRVPLPTYPFQRQRYWIDGAPRGLSGALPAAGQAPSGNAANASEDPSEMSFDTIAALPKLAEDEWLHLPVWRQTALPAAAGQQPGSWLVYAHESTADEVVAGLRRTLPSTATVDVVRPGDGYAAVEDGFTVRPGNVEDTLALLRALRAAGRPLERAVHLWALAPAPDEVMLSQGVHTLVALARAAGELGMDTWSLDVVVSGTQQVLAEDASRPYAATLTGPCRVIPLEYPNVTSRLLDLDPAPIMSAAAITGLLAELQSPQADALVALRHGRRWLPEYQRMVAPAVTQGDSGDVLREGGVYLITGGLGGIALAMAERLARDYSAKLVLLGRNGLPDRSQWPAILAAGPESGFDDRTRRRVTAVSGLLEHGAEVEIVTGDVASTDDVRRAVELALDRFGALHGVLHVAGLPAMGLMQFKRPAELDLVLAPKVAGTLAIADALRVGKPDEIELDFLALFSSITSTTGGGPGQVDYCSGNAFLDSYAYQQAATGRRVLSINWGEWTWNAWEEGLTGYADVLADFFRENRIRIGIGFEEGWRSLLRVLACNEPRIVVSTQDFETMVGYSSKFTVAAVTSTAMSGGGGSRHPRPELVTSYQEPSGAVETAIAAIWAESLRLEQVGAADNFFELGGNSLLGVSIVAALRAEFTSAELPPHILYEAPTVAALGRVIETAQSGESGVAGSGGEGESLVRAQLRRSGLEASAGRRRSRQNQQANHDRSEMGTEQS